MKYLSLAAVGAAALLAVPAAAQLGLGGADAGPVTRAELKAKLDAKFAQADANHDGVLTREEWDAARAEKRAARKEKAFDRLDADRSGSISRSEWDAPRPDRASAPDAEAGGTPPPPPGHGRRHGGPGRIGAGVFDRLDADHDGKVTLAEFEARPLEMFDRADTDHDGTVSPDERKAAWEAMRRQWQEKRGE